MRHYPLASGNRGVRRTYGGLLPDRPGRLLQQARTRLYERRLDEALDFTDRALATMPRMVELLLVRSAALLDLGHPNLALAYLETGLDLDPANGDLAVERCRIYIEIGDLAAAREDLQELAASYPEDPEILYLNAMTEELAGDLKKSDLLYRQVAKLDSTRYPEPPRVQVTELLIWAREAVQMLPDDVRERIADVDIQVLPVPTNDLLNGPETLLPPTILGLFMGATMVERNAPDSVAPMPTRILLFQRNLERMSRNEEALREQVRITILHEVGHYLGMSEEDLEARGLE